MDNQNKEQHNHNKPSQILDQINNDHEKYFAKTLLTIRNTVSNHYQPSGTVYTTIINHR